MHCMRFILSLVMSVIALQVSLAQDFHDKNEIERVITESYLVPVYLRTNLEVIKRGFHDEFTMYVLDRGELSVQSRDEWIESIKKLREQKMEKRTYAWLFELIDVEEQTALAKIRITENGDLKYVDYLTLYKFKEGWRVVTKQFTTY